MQVELKISLARKQVADAMDALGLGDSGDPGEPGAVGFFEDATVGADLPLFHAGVVLRVRGKTGKNVKSTVKFRPGRMSQFGERWLGQEVGVKFEQDWGLKRAVLASSLDGETRRQMPSANDVRAGGGGDTATRVQPAAFFNQEQKRFLAQCAPLAVNLSQLTLVGPIPLTKWEDVAVGDGLAVVAERWTVNSDLDFLELSLKVDLQVAGATRERFQEAVKAKGLEVEAGDATKTELVLRFLAGQLRSGSWKA
ncbi:MAG: hypothetical protein AB7O92_12070 [Acidimicrobiia bacterium]